uniref:Uncharacterized protein n=1 Tax=viral metagenome TaxID=1070528 RepID=A0A6C0CY72_9ZZZZ
MMKFPKSFDSYNKRYYGNIKPSTTPSNQSLISLEETKKKLKAIRHINNNYDKQIERALRDTSGYSENMIQRLIKHNCDLYISIIKNTLLNPI